MKQLSVWESLQASLNAPHTEWSPWFRVKPEHLVAPTSLRVINEHEMTLLPEVQEWINERNTYNDVETIKSWGLMIRFKDDGILAEYMLRWGVQRIYLT